MCSTTFALLSKGFLGSEQKLKKMETDIVLLIGTIACSLVMSDFPILNVGYKHKSVFLSLKVFYKG